MKYIDTHMHVIPSEFENHEEIMKNAFEKNVKIMFVVGCEENKIQETIEFSRRYEGVYPIIGIHPNDATGPKDVVFIKEHFTDEVIAIGEIGLDYHWDTNPPIEIQIKTLEDQMDFALEKGIPVVIHSRDAHEDTIKVISQEKYKDLQIVMHSYAYGAEHMQEYLDLGCYLSFSGITTFKNAHGFKEAVKQIPANRILSETDAPYLAPVPHRGKTCEPVFVADTVNYIAELRGESVEQTALAIEENVNRIFKLQ